MRKLGVGVGFAIVTAGGFVACVEPFHAGTGGAGSTGTGTAGGPGSSVSTSSGASSTTGSPSTGSSSTTSTASSSSGSTSCSATAPCAALHYCDAATSQCALCTDFSRLELATPGQLTVPMPLASVNPAPTYPRLDAAGQMYFTVTGAINGMHLASAPAMSGKAWGPTAYLPSPPNQVTTGTGSDVAPLVLADGSLVQSLVVASGSVPSLAGKPVLLFDSDRGGAVHKVYLWPVGGLAGVTAPLMVQMPGTTVTASNQSRVAISDAAPVSDRRLWWVTDATSSSTGSARLVTAKLTDSGSNDVMVTLDDNCAPAAPVEPWVTRDGTYLLFGATYTCTPSDTTSHLFSLPLDADGQPASGAKAKRIFPASTDPDSTPSLSNDACGLVFIRGGQVFGATRQ